MATALPLPIFPLPKFDTTLGALLVGGLVATSLYGITVIQTFAFFASGTADRASHKALIAFLFILDTFDTFLNGHILYFYLVTNYLAPQAMVSPVWSLIIHVAATSVSNFIVRSAFTRRVYRRNEQPKYTFDTLDCFAVNIGTLYVGIWKLQADMLMYARSILACGLIITAKAFTLKSFVGLDGLTTLMYLDFAAGTSSDLSVALALCYLLHRSRTGFERTDSLIGVLIVYTVNTGLLVALDATAGMVSFIFMHNNFIFLGFYLLLSKLYLNSYLAILNVRKGLREKLDESKSIHLSRMQSTMRWRSGLGYEPEGQSVESQPTLTVSKSDRDTILNISLNSNLVVDKEKGLVEPPQIARAY
ncbi:hypothetical protein MVEN_00203100 [Mycena venus]|uniref:DUF6534 domain-containing protein n=1 Tax=Mycena venus TaxID=2733690 RepID=A0A8H6Z3T6_9AGAR|nr:hypothetical protein MVEN_00203100 [Mycena venus]